MSSPWTYLAQRARLRALGLACARLPLLTDVDTIASARAVARAAPDTRFAAALASRGRLGAGGSSEHASDHHEPVAERRAGARLEAPDRPRKRGGRAVMAAHELPA